MDHGSGFAVLAGLALCVLGWSLVAARLQRWAVSAPLAFVVLGYLFTHGPLAFAHLTLHSSTIRVVAELTLALVLFSDAARVNLGALRADLALPVRLLALGLPLTIGAGAAAGAVLLGNSGLWVAVLIGAIVAPTDAALGAAILSDERVPARVRRVLNVESGLNDGIATPFVNLFLAGALSAEALHGAGVGRAAIDLLGGAGLGLGLGLAGALVLDLAARRGWSAPGFRPLGVLALALLTYTLAVLAGLNGFVAAFVGGLASGTLAVPEAPPLEFTEDAGTLLSLTVWFVFGAVMLEPGLEAAGWRDLIFALLALSAVRMVPVALSLLGAGLDRATVAFIGWFGPRGLASVVFGLVAVDALAPEQARAVLAAVTLTVALSVLLHGLSATPLAGCYGARAATWHAGRPEHGPSPQLSTRTLARPGPGAAAPPGRTE